MYAHDKDINAVKIAPNEKYIASGSQDRSIKIWDVSNFAGFMTLKGHKRGVWDIAFSPVEKLLASASGDQTVKIWNLVDGSCINTLEGHLSTVVKVCWMQQGLELISAGGDGIIKLWNVKKATCVNTFEQHESKIWSLDVSNYDSEGKQYVISGGSDSKFVLWADETKEEENQKREEQHKILIEQNNIQNLLRQSNYIEACKVAFRNNFTRYFHQSLEKLFSQLGQKNDLLFSIENVSQT